MDSIAEFSPPKPEDVKPAPIRRKFINESVVVRRFGKKYIGGGAAEFRALQKLYAVDPDHVVRPIRVLDEGKSTEGFEMEFVPGKTLASYLYDQKSPNRASSQSIKEQMIGIIDRFQKNGVVHGDISLENILIRPEGTLVFLDPVAFGEVGEEELKQLMEHDRNKLHITLQSIDEIHRNIEKELFKTF